MKIIASKQGVTNGLFFFCMKIYADKDHGLVGKIERMKEPFVKQSPDLELLEGRSPNEFIGTVSGDSIDEIIDNATELIGKLGHKKVSWKNEQVN
jgi:hypothetical protein